MITEIVLATIQVLTILIVVRIIVSWVVMLFASMRWILYHPANEFLTAVTEPILGPIRSVMPRLGGFDFSPMIAIFALQFLGRIVAQNG